jgi:hypothetical protein
MVQASRQKRSKLSEKIKQRLALYGLTLAALVIPTASVVVNKSKPAKQPNKTEIQVRPDEDTPQATDTFSSVSTPTLVINFRRDTLEQSTGAIAYHSPTVTNDKNSPSKPEGQIVYNYIENNPQYAIRIGTLLHETKHNTNFKKRLSYLRLSPLDYIKTRAADEISANMVQVLTMRYEYLAARTPEEKEEVLKEYDKTRFSFYGNAIRHQKVFPEKKDQASRDQEWSFIMNETKKMWMKECMPCYIPAFIKMSKFHMNYLYKPTRIKEQMQANYRLSRERAFTIGGVNFDKYLKNDIEIQQADLLELASIGTLEMNQKDKALLYDNANQTIQNLKKGGTILSPDLLKHVYYSEVLKLMLKDIDDIKIKNNSALVNMCYVSVMSQLKQKDMEPLIQSVCLKESIDPLIHVPTDRETLESLYTYQGIPLYEQIPSLSLSWTFGTDLPIPQTPSSDWFLEAELDNLRTKAPAPAPQTTTDEAKQAHMSDTLSCRIPDFSKPILVSCTPEQEEEIFQCIREFNSVPKVVRGTDKKAKLDYMRTHNVSNPNLAIFYGEAKQNKR